MEQEVHDLRVCEPSDILVAANFNFEDEIAQILFDIMHFVVHFTQKLHVIVCPRYSKPRAHIDFHGNVYATYFTQTSGLNPRHAQFAGELRTGASLLSLRCTRRQISRASYSTNLTLPKAVLSSAETFCTLKKLVLQKVETIQFLTNFQFSSFSPWISK